MCLALPEEIEKIFHHNDLISDSTLTLPHIQRFLEDMMQEMRISAADTPTSWVTPVPIRLWFIAREFGHPLINYTHWWARSFEDTYLVMRIWRTTTAI